VLVHDRALLPRTSVAIGGEYRSPSLRSRRSRFSSTMSRATCWREIRAW
jgi:hypothetical protein